METQQGRGRLRVVTWNINGLRSLLEYANEGLAALFKRLDADETKLSTQDRRNMEKLAIAEGWTSFFSLNDSKRPFHGVATFCKDATAAPVAAEDGLAGTRLQAAASAGRGICLEPDSTWWWRYSQPELEALDNQGRCLITDHRRFVLFNLYLPASTRPGQTNEAGDRYQHKLRMLQVLDHRINALLHAGRAVLVVGDLNIAAYPKDHCHFERNAVMEAFLDGRPDRAWLSSIVGPTGSLVDLYRREHPEVQACSVWSFPGEYRDRGVVRWNGCRVDYMLAGGTLTLDPAARPGHAPARGGLASGAAAGAAPEAQQTGTPLSADVRKSGASPAAASSAQAPEQVPLADLCTHCDIWADFAGSDHAPVVADFALAGLVLPGRPPPPLPLSSRVRWKLSGQRTLSDWVTAKAPLKRRRHAEETPPRESPRASPDREA